MRTPKNKQSAGAGFGQARTYGLQPHQDNWREACVWRAARILRFTDRQRDKRQWIRFSELAERYGRNIGVAAGYEQLRLAVIAGEFERGGRSRVLYLHPYVTFSKMTRERMANATDTFESGTLQRQYLAPCWIPRELAIAWCTSRKVAMAGWLSGNAIARTRGRRSIDDGPALVEMGRLCESGYTPHAAATQVAALFGVRDHNSAAFVYRLRRKFAKQQRG